MNTKRHIPLMAVAAALSMVNMVCAADTWWVSKSRGDDAYTGADIGTYDHPYATIQAGVNKAGSGDTVKVEPGDYASGETYMNGSNRVHIAKKIYLKAVEGPANTRIVGKWNSADPTGEATTAADGDAVRCLAVTVNPKSTTDKRGWGTVVEGFTFVDGYNVSKGGAATYVWTEGTKAAGNSQVFFVDCVMTNCTGAKRSDTTNGPLSEGTYVRCRVRQCGGWSIFVSGAWGWNSVVTDCTALRGVFGYAHGVNCTLKDNNCSYVMFGDGSSAYNVLSMGKPNSARNVNSVLFECSLYQQSVLCVDPANEDWRLKPDTAAIGIGDAQYLDDNVSFADAVETIERTDYSGVALPTAGTVNAGAVQGFRSKVTVAAFSYGGVAMTGVSVGEQWIDAPTEVVITHDGTAETRRCLGVSTNGVTELFANHPDGLSFTVGDMNANIAVEPVYSTDWYVDAARPDDTGNGFTPETAKKTLASACTTLATLEGDTIHVAPGVYNTGVCAAPSGMKIGARASVPAGVTLQADGAVGETVIEGAEATEGNRDMTGAKAVYKTGTDAVRCVYLNFGATVRGFTLRNGRTRGDNTAAGAGTSNADFCGGGVACLHTAGSGWESHLVENCTITNCAAAWGGGATGVRLVGCRMVNNYATRFGRQANYCSEEGSCFSGPSSIDGVATASYAVFYSQRRLNSTYWADPSDGSYDNGPAQVPTNCVFICKVNNDAKSRKSDHCILLEYTSDGLVNPNNIETDTCLFLKNKAAFELDELFRPTSTNSPVVDFCAAYHARIGKLDAAGTQRVYNGNIDCGAYEYDWRGEYSAMLGAKRFTVETASPEVKATDGHVTLTDGASLVGTWAKIGRRQIPVAITGSGVLRAYVGDKKVGEAHAGDTVISYSARTASERMRLVFEGEGSAVLSWLKNSHGLIVVAN